VLPNRGLAFSAGPHDLIFLKVEFYEVVITAEAFPIGSTIENDYVIKKLAIIRCTILVSDYVVSNAIEIYIAFFRNI